MIFGVPRPSTACPGQRLRQAIQPPGSGRDEIPDQTPAWVIDEREAIWCRACGAAVTARRYVIDVDGQHAHIFFNPAGVLYEIGCFSAAPGCTPAGRPTTEFSLFAGHAWRYAHCAVCGAHLGWQFLDAYGAGFWGLVLERLLDGTD